MFVWGIEMDTTTVYTNDVGIQSFVSPVSGPDLTTTEVVTIMVKNYGTATQSNIPVLYIDSGTPVTGTVAGPIAQGESVEYTFADTVDLSTPGQTYVFDGCTELSGDENPDNDCKTTSVTHIIPTYCEPLLCEDPIDLLHTGTVPIGSPDPNWEVTVVPAGATGLGQAKTANWVGLGWAPPMPGTNWISIDDPPNALVVGTYVFEHDFFIDSLCICPSLRICIMVDDTANIYLNGNFIGTAFSQHSITTFNHTVLSDFIIGGFNILKVEVINDPANYTGFNLKGWVCCSSFPNPCDDVSVSYQQLDPCCYDIYLGNTQPATYITEIQFSTPSGFPSLNPTISTLPIGWTYTPPTFPSNILTLYPTAGSSGTFGEYFELCLENDPGSNPQEIIIEWIGYGYNQDTLICYDTLYLECPDTCECVICENPIHTITTGPGAPGSLSADWTLIAAPATVLPGPAINMGAIPGAWGAPFTGTNWISYCENGGGGSAPTGLYEYVTQFPIYDTCPNNMDMFLRICLLVDDTATIKLNGTLVGTATSEVVAFIGDFYGLPFIVGGGMNTLSIEVINNPGLYTGFDLKAWVCCGDAIPVTYCADTICDWNDPARFGNNISTYPCSPIIHNGPEAVFTFNLPASSVVTAELIAGPALFDIFILDTYPFGNVKACGTSTAPAIASLNPGIYFIVVDSPNWDDIDQFCFTLECDTCGDCEPLCEDPIDLLHTGTVPIGSPDPNWEVTVVPAGATGLGQAKTANWVGLGWAPPMPGTNWISIDDPPNALVVGTYVFEHDFFIDSLCICPSLRICIMVDDTANIYLNGNFIGTAFSQHSITTFNHTVLSDFIIGGFNILKVEVINDPANYTGFNLKGWVCCCECKDVKVRKWYLYQNAGLEFIPPDPPVVPDWTTAPLPGGMISTTDEYAEGCSVIHDKDGHLLFYTNGITIWDRNHAPMTMADLITPAILHGSFSSTQSALIVPQPCNNDLYYVFTSGDWGCTSGLNYSIVDITGNGGNGVVTLINDPLLPAGNSTEKLTYAHHGNGIDVWILTHGLGTDAFYAYQLNGEGILPPVISNAGSVYSHVKNKAGYLETNPQGDLLAAAIYYNGVNSFEVFDFNNNTGLSVL